MTHQFREDGSHYNGGAEFFGYGYRAVGEPRLKMIRRWYRQGDRRGQTEDRFFVDGAKVESYDEAVAALRTPPTLDAAEIAALAAFGDEPIKRPANHDREVLAALRAKGMIRAEDGLYTITEAGRAALAGAPQ